MSTHIDVLVGDYESCVRCNYEAILADLESIRHSPATAGTQSFYFGYIVHNYHMLVYGAILGGMETKGMEIAKKLNEHLTEDMFMDNENLIAYLEAYSALDIHVMVRFGRWNEILELDAPRNKHLMLFRSSSLLFARALARANLGDIALAKKEADRFDSLRKDPLAEEHILHNNSVSDLLAVDAPMLRGEIAYREGKHEKAFQLLREAVQLQDNLRYDEPWGKMQPIRHALGGLLLEQGRLDEAEDVFRDDLKYHPQNPWALVGLISCLKKKSALGSCCNGKGDHESEIKSLQALLEAQRKCEWADYNITVACECCKHP
jgi:tetratricopeptide (TPR) repeat protein